MATPRLIMQPLSRSVCTAVSVARTSALRTAHRRPQTNTLTLRSPSLPKTSSPPSSPQIRYSSYSSPDTAPNTRKKVTLQTIKNLYKKGEPIAMLTAYDFPTAHVADAAGIDIVLVGDSLGMVSMGLENTNGVVMEEMIMHCRSVVRGAKSAFIVSERRSCLARTRADISRLVIYPWAHMR